MLNIGVVAGKFDKEGMILRMYKNEQREITKSDQITLDHVSH